MNLDLVKPVVEAVLYEGYILYPYRPTSTKNRSRWTFGGIYPKAWFEVTGGTDPCRMQTQCLLHGDAQSRLEIRVRFLQPGAREVGVLPEALDEWPADGEPRFETVPSLTVDGTPYHAWQEAMERDVAVVECRVGELAGNGRRLPFEFDAQRDVEPIRDGHGRVPGVLVRRREQVSGIVDIKAESVAGGVYRVTVRIENTTAMDTSTVTDRDRASLYSFASTHTMLGVEDGRFVSLMDPPPELKAAADECDNRGAYPVLVGEPGACDIMLASPIILYDYPEVAPESPGDMYDATEIDEILSLNILAMTDDEKREMAAADPRAAALLARTEALNGDDFMRMHGTLRDPRLTDAIPAPARGVDTGAGITQTSPPDSGARFPDAFPVLFEERGSSSLADPGTGGGGTVPFDPGVYEENPLEPGGGGPRLACFNDGNLKLAVGDRVRLHPRKGGDVMDLVLDGKTAVIEGIERDFEDRVHVAVALDDDPGREWGLQRMPGHRFFFSPDEVESLADRMESGVPEAGS